jgi:hypothetical protein
LFEIGLHPNFANNSTQGDNVDDILKKLKEIVPNAESIRTHGLLQSSEILLKLGMDIEEEIEKINQRLDKIEKIKNHNNY